MANIYKLGDRVLWRGEEAIVVKEADHNDTITILIYSNNQVLEVSSDSEHLEPYESKDGNSNNGYVVVVKGHDIANWCIDKTELVNTLEEMIDYDGWEPYELLVFECGKRYAVKMEYSIEEVNKELDD